MMNAEGRAFLERVILRHFRSQLSEAELIARINEREPYDGITLLHCVTDNREHEGPEVLEHLLTRYKANPNVRDHYSITPIWEAITSNNIEHVRTLLRHGAYLNGHCGIMPNGERRSPLHTAYLYGHVEVAVLLIDKGADLQSFAEIDVPAILRTDETDAIYDYVSVVRARERRAQLACFALLLVQCLPRDVLRVVARLMWGRRRGERWSESE